MANRSDYSILIPVLVTAFASTTVWIALFDHYEVQFHRRKRTSGDVDHGCSSAIRINGIRAEAGHPLNRRRHPADKNVVHLGQITRAPITSNFCFAVSPGVCKLWRSCPSRPGRELWLWPKTSTFESKRLRIWLAQPNRSCSRP